MTTPSGFSRKKYDVVIIGAGPAGLDVVFGRYLKIFNFSISLFWFNDVRALFYTKPVCHKLSLVFGL